VGEAMKKILFLDIDGVLNSQDYYKKTVVKDVLESRVDLRQVDREAWLAVQIDPDAVAFLNTIALLTDAVVVVTSVWRFPQSCFETLKKILKDKGFSGEIIGWTTGESCRDCVRGNQIRRWLQDHEDIVGDKPIYVILDDDSDMLYWQRYNFVWVDGQHGLGGDHVTRALHILDAYIDPSARAEQ
jgi:hypothetical protein